MTRSTLRLPARLLAPALSAACALGQVPYTGVQDEFPWPASLHATAEFADGLAGQLTDDERPDAVLLVGDELVLSYSPGVHRALIPFAQDVVEVELIPSASSVAPDLVAAIDDAGLCVFGWTVNGSVRAMSEIHRFPDNDWVGAGRLRVASDGAGGFSISALEAGGATVLRKRWPPLQGPEDASLDLSSPAHRTVALDWSGSSALEVATLDAQYLTIRDAAGGILEQFTAFSEEGLLERLPAADGEERDALMYVGTYAPVGCQVLVILRVDETVGGVTLEPPIYFGPVEAGRLDLLDYDGNGALDLLVSSATSSESWLLVDGRDANPPSPHSFLPDPSTIRYFDGRGAVELLDGSGPAPIVLGGDFDGDGDEDLIHARSADGLEPGAIVRFRGDTYREDAQMAALDNEIGPSATSSGFTLDAFWDPAAGNRLESANRFEVVVWTQHAPTVASLATAPVAVSTCFHELFDIRSATTELTFTVPYSTPTDETVFHVQVTVVEFDETEDEVVLRGPTLTAVYTSDATKMLAVEDDLPVWVTDDDPLMTHSFHRRTDVRPVVTIPIQVYGE